MAYVSIPAALMPQLIALSPDFAQGSTVAANE
jgi:hypothetical protein